MAIFETISIHPCHPNIYRHVLTWQMQVFIMANEKKCIYHGIFMVDTMAKYLFIVLPWNFWIDILTIVENVANFYSVA